MNNGGGSDTHCFETKIKAAIVKLTNTRIARFERNIKLFSRYEAKIACRVGGVNVELRISVLACCYLIPVRRFNFLELESRDWQSSS